MLVKLAHVAKRPQVENTHFPCLVPYTGDSAPSPRQCSKHRLNHHQGCSCGSTHDSSCLSSTQNLLVLPYLSSRGKLGELQRLWKVTGTHEAECLEGSNTSPLSATFCVLSTLVVLLIILLAQFLFSLLLLNRALP